MSGTRPTVEPVRLAVWSGPRNISTALMRAWENRGDCLVVDEPLYAHYLLATGLDHPGRQAVIAAGEPDWRPAVRALFGSVPAGFAVHYQKHMSHHLVKGIPHDWIGRLHNVLLIRDPREVVASYVRSRATVTPADIGVIQQAQLYDELTAAGTPPPVVDAADFLRSPERYLRRLCDYAGVRFTDRMLCWPAGPRDTDGVWAPYWYDAVRASTGFAPWRPRETHLRGTAAVAAEACLSPYRHLHDRRLRA